MPSSFFGSQLTPLPSGEGKHVLITGATGVVGRSAVETFRAAGWSKITVCSRRSPTYDLEGITFLPLDLLDHHACTDAFRKLTDLTHIVYTAVYEKLGKVIEGWHDPEQMAKNEAMIKNTLDPVLASAPAFEHISFMQGAKAYGAHAKRLSFEKFPQKERHDRVVHPNFYWLQEDYVKETNASWTGQNKWSWTVWRPPYIIGHAVGGNLSALDALGAYAALCAEKKEPMVFGGRIQSQAAAVDSRLLGRAFVWATAAPKAKNEIFNIDNGDIFLMENIYAKVADLFSVAYAGPSPLLLEEEVLSRDNVQLWQDMASRYGLAEADLQQWQSNSLQFLDLMVGGVSKSKGNSGLPPSPGRSMLRSEMAMQTVKLRQAGFADCIDTEDMFVEWLEEMRKTNVLPKFQANASKL